MPYVLSAADFELLFLATFIIGLFVVVYLVHEKEEEKNRADNIERRTLEIVEEKRRKEEAERAKEGKYRLRMEQRAKSRLNKKPPTSSPDGPTHV